MLQKKAASRDFRGSKMSVNATRKRRPDETRETILQAAFEEIWEYGFQAASLDRILKRTGVTKGALYHHFNNKLELGYAVIEDVIRPQMLGTWLRAMSESDNPLDCLRRALRSIHKESAVRTCQCGCPLNNLALEMSPLDEGFRKRIHATFEMWRRGIAQALRQGQAEGTVRKDVDPNHMATFILASIEGTISLMKTSQDPAVFEASFEGLDRFLSTLEPEAAQARVA